MSVNIDSFFLFKLMFKKPYESSLKTYHQLLTNTIYYLCCFALREIISFLSLWLGLGVLSLAFGFSLLSECQYFSIVFLVQKASHWAGRWPSLVSLKFLCVRACVCVSEQQRQCECFTCEGLCGFAVLCCLYFSLWNDWRHTEIANGDKQNKSAWHWPYAGFRVD